MGNKWDETCKCILGILKCSTNGRIYFVSEERFVYYVQVQVTFTYVIYFGPPTTVGDRIHHLLTRKENKWLQGHIAGRWVSYTGIPNWFSLSRDLLSTRLYYKNLTFYNSGVVIYLHSIDLTWHINLRSIFWLPTSHYMPVWILGIQG